MVVAYEIRYSGLGFWPPVLAASAGAASSKVIMYYFGVSLRRPLRRNRNVQFLARYSNTPWVYLLAFAAAAVPGIPLDDFVYMMSGASGLRPWAMALVALAAKFVKTAAEVAVVAEVALLISAALHVGQVYVLLVFAAGGVVAGVLTLVVDWESAARRLGLVR